MAISSPPSPPTPADSNPSESPCSIDLYLDRFPGRPAYDTAVSHVMLRRVAAGALPESLRLYRPENVMLFSSLDARRPGYQQAVERSREAGFKSAIRLAGGHAAAFLEESMAFAWAVRDVDARIHIRQRFERLANVVVDALRRLGLDARVGEIPGEYCPGEFSVNLGGRVKVMGVGQRVIRDGAHVGGVLTIAQSESLRASLIPVYEALGLEFQPETAGGIADFDPSLTVEHVIESMRHVIESKGIRFEEKTFDSETLTAANDLEKMHSVLNPQSMHTRLSSRADGKTLLQTDQRASQERSTKRDPE